MLQIFSGDSEYPFKLQNEVYKIGHFLYSTHEDQMSVRTTEIIAHFFVYLTLSNVDLLC